MTTYKMIKNDTIRAMQEEFADKFADWKRVCSERNKLLRKERKLGISDAERREMWRLEDVHRDYCKWYDDELDRRIKEVYTRFKAAA